MSVDRFVINKKKGKFSLFVASSIYVLVIDALFLFSSIARHVQKHARLVAVVESLDNGKTIRETRDCDIPLVVRHLYYHAGWAQLMDTEMKGWKSVGESSFHKCICLMSNASTIRFVW